MTGANQVKTQLRLPASLQERLVAATKISGRSLNAEIVHRLEGSFPTVEGVIVKHRISELVMVMEMEQSLKSKLDAIEATLALPGTVGSARSELLEELERLRSSVAVMSELMLRTQADLDLIYGTPAGQMILDAPVNADKGKKVARKKVR